MLTPLEAPHNPKTAKPITPISRQSPDELTVVVFKDNFSARTFRVPLRWISRIGTFVAILALASLLSSLLAAKYYRLARRGNPGRVGELEDELNNLRTSYSSLQAKALTDAKKPPETVAAAPGPVPTVTVTVTPVAQNPAVPAPSAPTPAVAVAPRAGGALLFQDLPGDIQSMPANTGTPTVTLSVPKFHWHANMLDVQAALEYASSDGGNQQGHIVVLARGPATIFAYPDGVLNPGSAATLIAPERGETFSVSRYREVKATFGPVRSASSIQEVEILIFGSGDAPTTLLIHQRVPVPVEPSHPTHQKRPVAPENAASGAEEKPSAPEPATRTDVSTAPPAGASGATKAPVEPAAPAPAAPAAAPTTPGTTQ